MAFVVFVLNWLFVYLHLRNSRKRILKVYAKHRTILENQGASCTEYTIGLVLVALNANLYLFVIIIVWSIFEILSPTTQFTFFQMMTAKKNLVLQVVSGDFLQNEIEITCSWSNAGGASTAGTVSNSSWFSWS
jgi:hypothetical protein